jgi:hypothetical protein
MMGQNFRSWLSSFGAKLAISVLCGAIALLHLLSLMRFPPPFVDEAWLTSRAWAFLSTGRAFGPLDSGIGERFDGYWTYNSWLTTWIHSLGLRLTDTPSLFATRLVSLLFGLLLLIAIYVIGSRLGGRRLGLLSAFLVSVSWAFFVNAHLVRYDILAAALGFIAIAFYFYKPGNALASLASGLCVGLAFEIHPYSLMYGPAIAALYLVDQGWSALKSRSLWSFVLGASAGIALYVGLHVLPYPQTYLAFNRLFIGPTHTPPLLTLDIGLMSRAILQMGLLVFDSYRVGLLLVSLLIMSIWGIVTKRFVIDKRLLVLLAVLFLGDALLFQRKFYYYAILFTPLLDLAFAGFVLYAWQRRSRRGTILDSVNRVIAAVFVISSLGIVLKATAASDGWQDFQKTESMVRQAMWPGEVIMGAQTYWFGLYDHKYFSWEQLVYYRHFKPGSSVADAFREFRPDVFIMDGHVAGWLADQPRDDAYSEYLRLPRTEMEDFLGQHANLIATVNEGAPDPIRIYRISWE